MKNKILSILFLFVFALSHTAQTRFKVLFQNVLNYSTSSVSQQKTPYIKTILDEVQPDLFMVCEVVNEQASNYLFNNAVLASNGSFNKAKFEYSQSPATGLQQMIYYNTSKFTLLDSDVITTSVRDINRYTFQINTENSDNSAIKLEVFVTHLKASRGSQNMTKRNNAITKFVSYLSTIPSNSYVLFAGDFNFYTSNEPGYINLINENNPIVMVDPINSPCPKFPNDGVDYFDSNNYNSTYFWNNYSFKNIHTQSTRNYGVSVIDDSGALGGMDDRFDFIMMSKNFNTSSNLYYVNGSYKAVGNNGNCYNRSVNDTRCTGEFSQDLREAVLQASDHLPVLLEIETPQRLLSNNHIKKAVKITNNVVADNLELSFNNYEVKSIYIYNQLGQLVVSEKITQQQKVSIPVNHLKNGMYFLRTNKHQYTLKFIKQ